MNETISNIVGRRSIRNFKPEPVPRKELDLIIQAGLYAPSARNRQPWHLCVLQGLERISRLNAEVKAATARMPDNPYAAFVGDEAYTVNYHAPVFIVVSADPQVSSLALADCSLVLGNMFIAANSLGIGSCWINQLGPLSREPGFMQVLAKLGVPAGHHVYGCGAFGYAASRPEPPQRRAGTLTFAEDF